MFKIGDIVVYSATGVCRVEDLCKKVFGSFCATYYVLKPLMQKKSTVFVPVDNTSLTEKIHPVLSKQELAQVMDSAVSKKAVRPENEFERRNSFIGILESGDRESLFIMVFDLFDLKNQQLENGRRLHIADERLLNSAKNLLFEEIAYVFGLDMDGAENLIREKIASR